jgi:hypothetical protein
VRGRWNASLDWRTVVARADLPPELAELVSRTVRRTRLWRGEKVDVATELVAHFQDGLEAGRTPQQLVQSFGDPLQAARLIRRAKRRGRPLVWHLCRYGLWTVFVVLLLYALAAMCLLILRPTPSTDYVAELNADVKDLAPDQRAWPLYRSALVELRFHGRGLKQQDGVDLTARPGDEHWPGLKRFLADHAEALARLRTAAARPQLGYEVGFEIAPQDRPLFGTPSPSAPPIASAAQPATGASTQPMFNVLLPDMDALRAAARILEADTYRAVEDGDAQSAYEDVIALLGVTRQAGESPFLVSGLVTLQIEGFACDAIEHVMIAAPGLWSDRQIAGLAHRLSVGHYDVAAWFDSERMSMRDMVQRLYTDDGHGDGTITYAGLKWLTGIMSSSNPGESWPNDELMLMQRERLLAPGMPLAAGIMASRAELEKEYDKLFAMAKVDVQTPLWKKHDTMDDAVIQLVRSQWLRLKYAPILYTLSAIDSFCMSLERARGRVEGVMIGLALELYHRENGHWPASLEELSPRWLPAVPVDRINGGPLGYRIVDNRPVVYSLGNDTDDDGGRRPASSKRHEYDPRGPNPTAEDGDWVIWSTVPPDAAPKAASDDVDIVE